MQITYTATHIAGDGARGVFIQSQMLQGVFSSSSHSDRFSGVLHPFSRSFFTPVQGVATAIQCVLRPWYELVTTAVKLVWRPPESNFLPCGGEQTGVRASADRAYPPYFEKWKKDVQD